MSPRNCPRLPSIAKSLRKRSKWENPEASVGKVIKVGDNKYTYWEAIGPAQAAFKILGPKIKEYLERCAETVPHVVTFSIYMMGKTQRTAAPILLFICEDVQARKEIQNTIANSTLLQNHPGIDLGDCQRAPDMPNPRALESTTMDDMNTLTEQSSDYWGPSTAPLPSQSLTAGPAAFPFSFITSNLARNTVYSPVRSCHGPGQPIFVRSAEEGPFKRRATVGGIVYIGSKTYCWTVAHIFEETEDAGLPADEHSQASDDCSFDEHTELDEDETIIDPDVTSRGSLNPELEHVGSASSSDETGWHDSSSSAEGGHLSPSNSKEPGDPQPVAMPAGNASELHAVFSSDGLEGAFEDLRQIGSLAFSSKSGSRPSLDYSLIEVTPEYEADIAEVRLTLQQPSGIADVAATTGPIYTFTAAKGHLQGTLSATPTYRRLPNAREFQELYTVSFEDGISEGDCGAWILDSHTDYLYGHIVAGDPVVGRAYMVPATLSFADLEANAMCSLEHIFGPPRTFGIRGSDGEKRSQVKQELGDVDSAVGLTSIGSGLKERGTHEKAHVLPQMWSPRNSDAVFQQPQRKRPRLEPTSSSHSAPGGTPSALPSYYDPIAAENSLEPYTLKAESSVSEHVNAVLGQDEHIDNDHLRHFSATRASQADHVPTTPNPYQSTAIPEVSEEQASMIRHWYEYHTSTGFTAYQEYLMRARALAVSIRLPPALVMSWIRDNLQFRKRYKVPRVESESGASTTELGRVPAMDTETLRDAIGGSKSMSVDPDPGVTGLISSVALKNTHLHPNVLRRAQEIIRDCLKPIYVDSHHMEDIGPYFCTQPDCVYRAQLPYDWKRHEEMHQPQSLWLCPICSGKDHPTPFLVDSPDKLRHHAMKDHPGEAIVPDLCWLNYQPVFDGKCPFCDEVFSVWEERCNHLLNHFDGKGRSTWGTLPQTPESKERGKSPSDDV